MHRWTEEEKEYIKTHYGNTPNKEIAKYLGRTNEAVNRYASKHGLKKEPPNDIGAFMKEHPEMDYKEVAKALNVSYMTVNSYCYRHNITSGRNWTQEQIEYLKANYSNGNMEEMSKHLDRSIKAIQLKAYKLGLKYAREWAEKDIQFFRENYKKMNYKDIAEAIGKTEYAVNNYAYRNGYNKNAWTEEEKEYLHEYFGTKKIDVMERALKKSKGAILSMAQREGLGSFRNCMYDLSAANCAEMLGKRRQEFSKYCRKGKIPGKKINNYWQIKEKDLLKWMQENPDKWDATKCDYYSFYRFEWFVKKYQKDSKQKRQDRWGQWYA